MNASGTRGTDAAVVVDLLLALARMVLSDRSHETSMLVDMGRRGARRRVWRFTGE